ncbi:MAG: radical SAM protein [Acetatifactor sp.]|nr:radical SAM protein [Acetatifactor sp.]
MRDTAKFCVFGINDKFYLYDWNRIESYGISQEIFDYLSSVKDFTKEMFVRDLRLNYAGFKKGIITLLDEGRLYYDDNESHDEQLIDISTINITCGIGYKCNLDCEYCVLKEQKRVFDNINEAELITNLVHLIEKLYSRYKEIRVTITDGGEPFLFRSQLFELMEKLKIIDIQKKVKLTVVTNGTVFDEEILRILDDNMSSIVFSLDGHLDNTSLRKSKDKSNNYEISKNNYEKFQEILRSKISKNIWAITVINAKTQSLVSTLNDLYAIGFRTIQMRIIKGYKDSIGLNKSNLEHFCKLYDELFAFFRENIEKGEEAYLKAILNNGDFAGQLFAPLLLGRAKFKHCLGAYSTISIDHEGKIFPCSFLNGNQESEVKAFEEADNVVEKYRNLDIYTSKYCRDCWASTVCGGHCPYQSMQGGYDYDKPDPAMCELTKHVIKNLICLIDYMESANFQMYENVYNFVKKRTYIYDLLE